MSSSDRTTAMASIIDGGGNDNPTSTSTAASSSLLSASTAEALLPASRNPQVWRHAAVDAITHTEEQMADLVSMSKELSIAQQHLRRSLQPLMEETRGGQVKLSENVRQSTIPLVDSVIQLVKLVEEEMFNYAHEKTRHTMLLDLHGVSGSPVETPQYGKQRASGLDE